MIPEILRERPTISLYTGKETINFKTFVEDEKLLVHCDLCGKPYTLTKNGNAVNFANHRKACANSVLQLESYPYYENMKTFNNLDRGSDHDYEVEELQRGPNGYGYDLQSSDNSDPVLPDDPRLKRSPQIESERLGASDNNLQAALDQALADNRSLSAQNTSLNAQNKVLLDIIERLGDIFSDITQPVRRFRAPARFRDSLNVYFLDNGVEDSQVD
ncbi:hypothetical protein F5880DRAFT_1671457 [Lentinula raphanica]|nr:hypothetical protein F5880DRAFT_1671457 [Lentinula raphanica]